MSWGAADVTARLGLLAPLPNPPSLGGAATAASSVVCIGGGAAGRGAAIVSPVITLPGDCAVGLLGY